MADAAKEKKKKIRAFAAASFLNDMGSDIIYPVWPLFVTQILKANMAALGLIDGLGEAVVSISKAVSGYVSDRTHRRKSFIWMGYLCGALSRLGYAASSVWPHLIPFRVLDRAGKIRSAPRDAEVADITTDADRGRAFGLLRAMDNFGAFFGILICLAFFNVLGYRRLFALAAVPSLAAAAIIIVSIKEQRVGRGRVFKGLSLRRIDANLRRYVLMSGIFALGAFTYSFLLLAAKEEGFKAGFVPLLYLVYTAFAALFSLPFGRLADRVGRKPVLFLALGFWAAVCLGVILFRNLTLLGAVFVLYGLHKAALDPVQKALVAELAPPEFRASVLGGFQMVIGLAALPASLLAGFLWDAYGRAVPFAVSLGLTAVSALLLLSVHEKRPDAANPSPAITP